MRAIIFSCMFSLALLFGGCSNPTKNETVTYTLTVSATNGTVVKSPNLAAYDSNSMVQLTATPATGYHFVDWSGDTAETANPLSVRMSGNKNITANFTINTYTLTVNAGAGGTVSPAGDSTVNHGAVTAVTATSAPGYRFVRWTVTSGSATIADTNSAATTVTLSSGNAAIQANFFKTYTLTTAAAAGGTVTAPPSSPTAVDSAAATAITATPDFGNSFARWTRSGTSATIADSTHASTTVALAADATVTAEFAINHAPDKPSSPSPADGATDQNRFLLLSWTGGDVDAGDTVKYDVYLSTINPPATKVSSAQTGTVYNASGLSVNTTYYWYVLATDGKATTQGDVWHFTTLSSFPDGMKLIPSGTFQMGSTNGNSDERPVHKVILSAFYMDTTEVTQADYVALMLVNPSYFDSGSTWPVESVTWFDAVLYCNARSKNNGMDTVYTFTSISGTPGDSCWGLGNLGIDYTKNGYRLPTEAEWEYACRAGSTTDYYWGGSYPPTTTADTAALDNNVVWPHNSNYSTAKVGTKLPNAWGLYDMNGNLWEWCNDWYSGSYYSVSPLTDPTGPTGSYLYRVMRGGSWHYSNYDASYFRSAYRDNNDPVHKGIGDGFRCVRR